MICCKSISLYICHVQNQHPEWLFDNAKCSLKHSNIDNEQTSQCPKGTIPILRSDKQDTYVELNTPYIDIERREVDSSYLNLSKKIMEYLFYNVYIYFKQ